MRDSAEQLALNLNKKPEKAQPDLEAAKSQVEHDDLAGTQAFVEPTINIRLCDKWYVYSFNVRHAICASSNVSGSGALFDKTECEVCWVFNSIAQSESLAAAVPGQGINIDSPGPWLGSEK